MKKKPAQYVTIEPNIARRDGAERTTFRVRIRAGGGVMLVQIFDTLEEARAWLRSVRTGDVQPVAEAPARTKRSGKMPWGQWCTHWLETHGDIADSTRATYVSVARNHLVPAIGEIPLEDICASDIVSLMEQMRVNGKKQATIAKARQVLNLSLALAYADKVISHNPMVGLPRRRKSHSDPGKVIVRRYVTVEELDLLEANMDPWWQLAVRVQIELGCRIGELAALHVRDVDLERGVVFIRGSMKKRGGVIGKTKTDAGVRAVNTLMPDTCDRIAEQIKKRGQAKSDLLFTGPRGGRLDQDTYRRRKFNPAMQTAGLGHILDQGGSSTHVLRHTLTTNLVQHAHMSPQQVALLLGHKDSRVTDQVYLHLESTELPDNRDKLEQMYRRKPAS